MCKLKLTIFSFVLLVLITGCNTIKQKTDAIVEKENQKLSKFIGKSSNILQTDLGNPDEDFINDVQNWKDTEITKKKKSFYKNFDKIFKSDQRRPN